MRDACFIGLHVGNVYTMMKGILLQQGTVTAQNTGREARACG